jgi:hypothetical protein
MRWAATTRRGAGDPLSAAAPRLFGTFACRFPSVPRRDVLEEPLVLPGHVVPVLALRLGPGHCSVPRLKLWFVAEPLSRGHPWRDLLRSRNRVATRRAPLWDREYEAGVAQGLGEGAAVARQHEYAVGHRLDRHAAERHTRFPVAPPSFPGSAWECACRRSASFPRRVARRAEGPRSGRVRCSHAGAWEQEHMLIRCRSRLRPAIQIAARRPLLHGVVPV